VGKSAAVVNRTDITVAKKLIFRVDYEKKEALETRHGRFPKILYSPILSILTPMILQCINSCRMQICRWISSRKIHRPSATALYLVVIVYSGVVRMVL
jgi:hypothetical protein